MHNGRQSTRRRFRALHHHSAGWPGEEEPESSDNMPPEKTLEPGQPS